MRCLVLIAVVITAAVARPETYREKEDFQYSRSSSDEGSKSGYYGAQRGNMGGNYERAHNMDSLAQHQMSGLVHQVEGEVGDTSNTNAGNVYTAASSRGMYGSGHYDLSNLEGRNFQEGTSYGDAHSQSALTNSAYRNHAAGLNSYSNSNSYLHSSRHSTAERSEHEKREEIQSSNLKSGESAYQQHGAYGGAASDDYSWSPYQNRLVSTRPMRILVRPGTKVAVPIATQTYDAEHSASAYDAAAFNQHAAKSDAEVLISNDHVASNRQVPTSKHYESSYSYRKEWEKHHSSPGAVPLGVDIDSSIPKTSELYDDSQHSLINNNQHQYAANAADSHSHQSSSLYGYNSRSNLASTSQSKHQSDYEIQQANLNALNLNAHHSNLNQDYASQQALVNTKPKSYQSSYSYHKSWERQGDPYVIVPVPDVQNGLASQKLSTASNAHNAYSSHQYGLNHKQSHQSYTSSNGLMDCDCDDEGHIRVARSYNTDQETQQQQSGWEDFGQQSQNLWDGQQTQNMEDFGQNTQNQFDRIEDFGQQSQNQWDKTEDLGQQTLTQFDKIEDLGQQSQNQWDKTEDLGQQTLTQFDKIEDLGQPSQNQWDKTEDLGQQTLTQFDKIEDLGQHTSQNTWDKNENLSQQTQTQFDKIEDLGQYAQNPQDLEQHSQNHWDKIEDLGQHSQSQWNKHNEFDQQSQQSNVGQEHATWNKFDKSNEDTHAKDIYRDQSYSNTEEQQNYFYSHLSNDFHTQHTDKPLSDSRTQHTSSINSLWDKLDRLNGDSSFNSNFNTNDYTSFKESDEQSNLRSTTTENVIVTDKTIIQPKDLGRGDIPDTFVVHPKNIGRGDIPDSPEGSEFLKYSSTTEKHNTVSTTPTSYNKVNQFKETPDITSAKSYEDKERKDINQQSMYHHSVALDQQNENLDQQNMQLDTQNLETPFTIVDQQNLDQNLIEFTKWNENLDQQKDHAESFDQQNQQNVEQDETQKFEKPVEKANQKNLDQNLVEFSKWNENLEQQNNHDEGFDQQNQQNVEQEETQNFEKPVGIVDQPNLDQNLVNFAKWNENLEQKQQPEGFDQENQQNVEQETQHFEKLYANGNQQNLDQNFMEFSKWNENLNQQNNHAEDIHQQNQQNVEQEETQHFEKPVEIPDQQNFDQNLVNFAKWNENLEQKHHPEAFDQQNQQNMKQETQHFEKPVEIADQQNLEQNFVNFGEWNENLDKQKDLAESFDQQNQKNVEQKETHQFVKPVEIADQQNSDHNLVDFSKWNEKLDQQNNYAGSFDQQNQQDMGQDLLSFDKPSDNHNEQNLDQNLVILNQISQNAHEHSMYQQSSFHTHSEKSNQLNMEQELQNFNKRSESFTQENKNQNLEDFSSLNKNFDEQGNTHNFERLDGKNEHLGQEVQNFDKPVEIYDQKNLNQDIEDFSKFHQQNKQHSQDVGNPNMEFDQMETQILNKHFEQQEHSYNKFEYGTGRENYDGQILNQNLRNPAPGSELVQKQEAEINSEHYHVQNRNKLLFAQQTEQSTFSETVAPPTEPPKTGFWSSVGKKFSGAKDKVSSWFRKKSD